MAEEELVGPICIITANGMVCMDSRPVLRYKDTQGTLQQKRFRNEPLTRDELNALVKAVAGNLGPKGNRSALASASKRRDIARLAVFLAEAAKLMEEYGRPLSFKKLWTIVKRP